MLTRRNEEDLLIKNQSEVLKSDDDQVHLDHAEPMTKHQIHNKT